MWIGSACSLFVPVLCVCRRSVISCQARFRVGSINGTLSLLPAPVTKQAVSRERRFILTYWVQDGPKLQGRILRIARGWPIQQCMPRCLATGLFFGGSGLLGRLQDSTRVWTEQPLSGTGKAPPGARICATRPAWPTQSPAIGQLANDLLSLHDAQHAQHAQHAQLRPDCPSKAKSHPRTWPSTARRVKPSGRWINQSAVGSLAPRHEVVASRGGI
jgi:hypothetical protein